MAARHMVRGDHAAVVLAAGGSRRLGHAKQLLRRDGETLVHRAVRLAATTRPRRLLVVTGADAVRVDAALAGLGHESRFNPRWESGLSSSLRIAVEALQDFDGATLILGCDQPALEGRDLAALLAGAATAASACAATRHGVKLGIPAVVSAALRREALSLRGDQGLGAQLTRLGRDAVWTLDMPRLMLDIDDGSDVEAAVARGWLDRASVPR